LFARLDVGNEQRLSPDIQHSLDQDRVIAGRPHDGGDVIRGNGLELLEHADRIARRMLGVEHKPVITRARNQFGGIAAWQAAPEAELVATGSDRCFEMVAGQVHRWSYRKETPIAPSGP